MNYVKNLLKILLLAQCFLLSCVYDKKEEVVVTTEQNRLNLADFVKCPFNEAFDDKTNLEKYVLKKFGKPDSFQKARGTYDQDNKVLTDWIEIVYEKYTFEIYKGVINNKRFEIFRKIYIDDYTDLKNGINNETTIKDIERIFGRPREAKYLQREESDEGNDTIYHYNYNDYDNNSPYYYHLDIGFRREKLNSIGININFKWITSVSHSLDRSKQNSSLNGTVVYEKKLI